MGSTLQFGAPNSLFAAFSQRLRRNSDPLFVDPDQEMFFVLLSILRSNRLPSTARRFSNQELCDEASYHEIESQLKLAMLLSSLIGLDTSIISTIKLTSNGIVSTFNAENGDGSVWVAYGGQVFVYDWKLTHACTLRSVIHCYKKHMFVGS